MRRLLFGLLHPERSYLQWNGLSMAEPQLCLGWVVISTALWLGLPAEISIFFGVKMER